MRGFDIKQIRLRAFQISGPTAKWGIDDSRKPSIWDNNLIGRWDARTFPGGALATIPNTATMAGKAPKLTVTGATMASGTLQFNGVNNEAKTEAFLFPKKFTVFWDVDWLGSKNNFAGIVHPSDLCLYNLAALGKLRCCLADNLVADSPNTVVGISSNGTIYTRDGRATPFGGALGTKTSTSALTLARAGSVYTQMGFRQLLIFNKELPLAEVNDVLRVMFQA